jgi:hypothetical protein
MTMDHAVLAKTRGDNRNKLITTLIYDLTLHYFVRGLVQHHGQVA